MLNKKSRSWMIAGAVALVAGTTGLVGFIGCSSRGGGAAKSSSGGGGGGSGGGTTTTTCQAINANQTNVQLVTDANYGGTCEQVTRDTSSCRSARVTMGFSGNWLLFSCNVVLGVVDGSGNSVANYASATYVTATSTALPDYQSNYYTTSGSYSFTANSTSICGDYSSMHITYSTSFPDPSNIASQSVVMYFPITLTAAGASTMSMGMVGMALNGVPIYDNVAANTDNIFAEAGSFDGCQGHPSSNNGGTYHYHSEPSSLSSNDNNVIGILRDGYWVYGRKDHDATLPGSTANLEIGGTASTIYKYGGHVGTDPLTGAGGAFFHYHLTEWVGCYHESGGTKSTDDGESDDTINTDIDAVVTPSCGGKWVDTWFMTGHGNGGVFNTLPSGLIGQNPSQTTTAIRYYYGTPAALCTNCN